MEHIRYAGVHIIADFWHGKDVANPKELKKILLQAAKESQNTPLEVSIHAFSPQGITGIVLLAESHIAIHIWPEMEYTAIDIFTCGKNMKPKNALNFLQKHFNPKKKKVRILKRGSAIGR